MFLTEVLRLHNFLADSPIFDRALSARSLRGTLLGSRHPTASCFFHDPLLLLAKYKNLEAGKRFADTLQPTLMHAFCMPIIEDSHDALRYDQPATLRKTSTWLRDSV